jgi:hypothetical protein
MAICHESDDRVFSHSTLWRFLACLGGMTVSISLGLDLFLKAFPESTIHRFTGSVSPRKYRSEQRSQALRDATRLLHLISRWDKAFPKEKFFPRFATRVRAP